MRIGVQGDADVAVSHKILERFRVHSRSRHVAAVGVAANVRSYVRDLQLVDLVVPLYHVIESVFPVHCHKRIAVLVGE